MEFNPQIVAFLCNWCSYTGADLAGTSRMEYKPNVRAIRVMCSGRIEPTFVLSAFTKGADGVMVLTCHEGNCHSEIGNRFARRRVDHVQNRLASMGFEKERLVFDTLAANMSYEFSAKLNGFKEKLMDLDSKKII